MNTQLLSEYHKVSMEIGKLYSDIERLEEKAAQMRRQLENGSALPDVPKLPKKRVDKQATAKTTAFLEKHFRVNKICTPQMLVDEFGCTATAADNRLRRASMLGEGKLLTSPTRLERNNG